MNTKVKSIAKVLCLIVALLGVFLLASCEESECQHEWTDATCTAPKTCEKCDETEGRALGHRGGEATCAELAVCSACGESYGELLPHDLADATCEDPKTCKNCSATEGKPIGHKYVYTSNSDGTHTRVCANDANDTTVEQCSGGKATCVEQATCEKCNARYGEKATVHDWADATCTAPKICKDCQTPNGEPLGHSGGTATCTKKAVCEACKQEYGELLPHDFADATCTAPKTCKNCPATEGAALAHTGGTATCTKKAVCDVCKNEYGELLPHDFADATCTLPKTCKNCPATDGAALGHSGGMATCTQKAVCAVCSNEYGELLPHDFADATCTLAKTCKSCPATDGTALGHVWSDATCDTPKTCGRCGGTEGSALGHAYTYVNLGNGTHTKVCANDAFHTVTEQCGGGTATCKAAAVCSGCNTSYGSVSTSHSWKDATCTTAAYCTVCQITDGEPDGHDYNSSTGKCKYCTSKVSVVLFTNTPDIFISSSSQKVIFYAQINTTEYISSVVLYDSNGNSIATMYDNGNYDSCKDEFSNDGIYTCEVSLNVNTYKNRSFNVVINNTASIKSNDMSINWVEKISQTQINNMATVDSQISSDIFTSNFDNLKTEEKKELAQQKIDTLVQNNLINKSSVVYNEDTSTFTFIYESGAFGAIVLEKWVPDNKVKYDDPADILPNAKLNGDAIILWSFDQSWDIDSFRSPFYSSLAQAWSNSGLNTSLNKNVTVDSYKKLKGYEVIMISAYGAYYEYKVGNTRTEKIPGIILSEEATASKDSLYAEDLAMHRIAKVSIEGGTKYVILPAFWEYYYANGGLDGSFVVSETSEFFGVDGDQDNSMANAILDASAEGVVGFKNSVMSVYSRNFAATYVWAMLYGYSSNDAFNMAKQLCGANDYFTGREAYGATAYPIYKGSNVQLVNSNLINGSFESDTALEGWTTEGDSRVIGKLGELSTTHKDKMAILTTGIGSGTSGYVGATEGSVIKQSFLVGANDSILYFDYDYVSEEPMEYVGSKYDDKFYVELITSSGTKTVLTKTINNSTWYKVSGINFQGGDSTAYHTGWDTVSIDVSAYRGEMVTIKFVVFDVGDSAYDSAALIDNVRLG